MAFAHSDYSELENVLSRLRKYTAAPSARLTFPKGCPVSCLETFNLSCCDGFLISELFLFPRLQFHDPVY